MGATMESFRKTNAASRRRFLLLAALACLAVVPAAQAFKLSPIKVEFAPSGRGANQAFLVENEGDQTIAVQVSMLTRGMDLHGAEQNAPADDDFIVYPSQILLRPKQVQTLRVQWVGDPQPEQELAYRILAEQMPIDVTRDQPTGAKINFIIRYLGAIYIVPNGARPDVVIDSVEMNRREEGERQLALTFHNRGSAHTILHDLELTLRAGGRTARFGPDDLKGIAGENLLAKTKRRFVIPWPAELPDDAVSATFDYRRSR